MVVRKNMAYSQTLWKKTLVAREVVVMPVPNPPEEVQLLEGADELQDSYTPRLTIRQRHGKLFDELDLSGLDSWAPELADAACWLLAEYHDMFLLDPAELGCTHSMEHTIKVTDDTPFKEWFRWIPPPLVEEVWNHLQEMLDSFCYQVQPECLVQCSGVGAEEGWWSTVLHWLFPPECLHKKGLLPPAQNTRGIGEVGRCWTFVLLRSQIRVLPDKDGRGVKAVYHLYSR